MAKKAKAKKTVLKTSEKDYKLQNRHFVFETLFANIYGSVRELNKQRLLLSTLAIGAMFVVKEGRGIYISGFEQIMWYVSNACFVFAIISVLSSLQAEAKFCVKAVFQYNSLDDTSAEAEKRIKQINDLNDFLWLINLATNIFFVSGIISAILFAI